MHIASHIYSLTTPIENTSASNEYVWLVMTSGACTFQYMFMSRVYHVTHVYVTWNFAENYGFFRSPSTRVFRPRLSWRWLLPWSLRNLRSRLWRQWCHLDTWMSPWHWTARLRASWDSSDLCALFLACVRMTYPSPHLKPFGHVAATVIRTDDVIKETSWWHEMTCNDRWWHVMTWQVMTYEPFCYWVRYRDCPILDILWWDMIYRV